MQNFSINFSNPWLLLLLIPAVALTLIPFFRLNKKYRYNRNRITSIVLHMVVMILSISVLAGMTFFYQIPNENNEIILLVDMSETEEQSKDNRDDFIQTVLDYGMYDGYQVGVVTFGFDQVYAVPLTGDIGSVYDQYLSADLPDTSATDIAAAITFAKNLFNHPETGKIVLITDGKETDEQASTVVRVAAASGILVDTVYISSAYEGDDVQLMGVVLPDYHVGVDEECTITLTVQSSVATTATIELYDNGEVLASNDIKNVSLINGTQTITFNHTFKTEGLHEVAFVVAAIDDSLTENNSYTTYFSIEVFDKILILERASGESVALEALLTEEDKYEVDVISINGSDVPMTVDELREYDQVILNNIANKDMPEGFDELLYSYVYDFGGGVFTVGGNGDDGSANAYSRKDMFGTLYQEMLPVQAIDYTPPLGLAIIIDRSGSMSASSEYGTYLDWARAGADACLQAMTERDYIGLWTLDSEYGTILEMTPRTQESKIYNALASIDSTGGGTMFSGAIERAGQALLALKEVEKRHMIIVTDGMPGDSAEDYEAYIADNYKNGITLSIVVLNASADSTIGQAMAHACEVGGGRLHPVADMNKLILEMREDLNVPEIKEVNIQDFYPQVYNSSSSLVQDLETEGKYLTFTLGGFYGVKVRANADLILVGDYSVPIYAQWKFGKGMVGSFMCDLNGVWSANFMADENGKLFLYNVLDNLMPLENIRPNEISAPLIEENYINKLSVYTELETGEYVEGEIVRITSSGTETAISLNVISEDTENTYYVTSALSAENNYSRCTFVVKSAGIYRITLKKCAENGEVIATYETYKSFSYSQEYNVFLESTDEDLQSYLTSLATRGNGVLVEDNSNPYEIFDSFVTVLDRIVDPRIAFMIAAIVLFLLDIVVRKFKFKWPHELIREYREKKEKD